MLHNVAVVVLDGFCPFEMAVACEVFGTDRSDDGVPGYDFAVVAVQPGPVRAQVGFTLQTSDGPERLSDADLVIIPAISQGATGHRPPDEYPQVLLDAVSGTIERGGRVLSICSGAFVLGAAGLLDGRRCTTHWRHADELARRFPAAKVDPAVLYVDEDPVITSAGTAAGIDACLHLVRKAQGAGVANVIARRMVVPPHRDGGQAQYLARPVPGAPADTLSGVLGWMERHLGRPMTVARLAERASMSPRTFARRFHQETGTTPQRWLTGQRILAAQQLLEETDATIEAIAERTGFGSASVLRHHFRSWRATTPDAYRRAFRAHP
jgi:transcriptional regulator GlxA family with amidase domain